MTTVLAFRKGLVLGITEVLPLARLEGVRPATPAEVKALRLGPAPVIAALALTTGATLELACAADRRGVGLTPWETETLRE